MSMGPFPLAKRASESDVIVIGTMLDEVVEQRVPLKDPVGVAKLKVDQKLRGDHESIRHGIIVDVDLGSEGISGRGWYRLWGGRSSIWFLNHRGARLVMKGLFFPEALPTTVQQVDMLVDELDRSESSLGSRSVRAFLLRRRQEIPMGASHTIQPIQVIPSARGR